MEQETVTKEFKGTYEQYEIDVAKYAKSVKRGKTIYWVVLAVLLMGCVRPMTAFSSDFVDYGTHRFYFMEMYTGSSHKTTPYRYAKYQAEIEQRDYIYSAFKSKSHSKVEDFIATNPTVYARVYVNDSHDYVVLAEDESLGFHLLKTKVLCLVFPIGWHLLCKSLKRGPSPVKEDYYSV